MDIIIETYFGDGSGALGDLYGKRDQCIVLGQHDSMLAIGEILCAIGQGMDIRVTYAKEGDE